MSAAWLGFSFLFCTVGSVLNVYAFAVLRRPLNIASAVLCGLLAINFAVQCAAQTARPLTVTVQTTTGGTP